MKTTHFLHGSFKGIMLAGALILIFALVPKQSHATSYDYAQEAVDFLTSHNIMEGNSRGDFMLDKHVTREEFAAFIVRSLNLSTTNTGKTFSDVPQSRWSYDEVSAAAAAGIIKGYNNGTFDPDGEISRQDMALMIDRMLRYKKVPEKTGTVNFTDKDQILKSDEYDQAISNVVGWGIIQGDPAGTFRPTDHAIRAEAAKVIYLAYQVIDRATSENQQKQTKIIKTVYNITLNDALTKQMAAIPRTDLYTKYIARDAFDIDDKGRWIITYDTKNKGLYPVRNGPGSNYPIIGYLKHDDQVYYGGQTVTDANGLRWYKITGWMIPLQSDVLKYLDPNHFSADYNEYYQFIKLSQSASINADEVNQKILAGKGILAGKAQSFIDAGKQYNINELYLISHALLETGNGTSDLSKGVHLKIQDNGTVTIAETGKPYDVTVYNMYGYGAKDSDPLLGGATFAYEHGWTTPEKAIIGGAQLIAQNYINKGQDTLYKMRWNPDSPGTHQYATDIGWAVKQVNNLKKLYDMLDFYTLVFDVPVYK
nr:S-layer homology domain-containing protein [Tuberibacillus calidus]